MSTVVIRTCDRCKLLVPEQDQLWEVAITCEPIGGYRSAYHFITKQQKAEWCKPCVVQVGVFMPLLRAETEPKPPEIETVIRAIIGDELASRDRDR